MWPRYGAPGNSDVDSLEGVNKNNTLPVYDNSPQKAKKTNTPECVDFRQKIYFMKIYRI